MCAGTHAPGRGEGVEWSRSWLGEIVTAGGSCRACKGQSQCQVVEKLSHILSEGGRVGQYLQIMTAVMARNKSCTVREVLAHDPGQ